MGGARHHRREPEHGCDERDRTLRKLYCYRKCQRQFDMTGLPERLVYAFCFSAHGDRIVQLIILRNRCDVRKRQIHRSGCFGSSTAPTLRSRRAKCSNFAKSAAILQKHEQARFSMSVTSGLGLCGGVENINANSDPLETPIQLKRHYEQSEATQGERYANPSS